MFAWPFKFCSLLQTTLLAVSNNAFANIAQEDLTQLTADMTKLTSVRYRSVLFCCNARLFVRSLYWSQCSHSRQQ